MTRFACLSRAFAGVILCAAATFAGAQSTTVNDVHAMNGDSDGGGPSGPMMQASDGNFYGVTPSDGANGYGTIYKYTPAAGTYKVLHSFDDNKEGSVLNANAGLTEGPDGNLYGVTAYDGVNGDGCFFQINLATGVFKVVHSFGAESYNPATLTLGSDGNFYAATQAGGSNGNGTLLRITLAGAVTTIYTFPGGTGASAPQASLLETSPLTFYGVNMGSADGFGGIFEAVVSGTTAKVTTPVVFDITNGAQPNLALVEYADGTLYSGTDQGGSGSDGGVGTIFKYDPATAKLTTVYDLNTSPATTGIYPNALVLGSDHNFYFPTMDSTTDCFASINEMTPAGAVTTIYDGNTAAARSSTIVQCPDSGLVQASDGTYYGTSQLGDADNTGDLYQVVPGNSQPPPVEFSRSGDAPVTGTPYTLYYDVLNAYSVTAQQCYAFVQGGLAGAGNWSGKQTGTASEGGYNGSATITPTADGTYTYALTCGGTESGFLTVTFGPATKPASTVTFDSVNSPTYGGTLAIAVQVNSGSNTGPAPTGTVTFTAGTATLGTVTLTPGTGAQSTAALSVKDTLPRGTYTVTATYNGDSNYAGSSANNGLIIAALASKVTITPVAGVQYGSTATFTVTIASASGSGPAPTGTATINVPDEPPVSLTLGGGTTGGNSDSVTISFVVTAAPGTYSISASYDGDNTYSPSSASTGLTVLTETTTTTEFLPSYIKTGQPVTLYARVSDSYGAPTGTVQFYIAGQKFNGPVTLAPSILFPNTAVASSTFPASLTAEAPLGTYGVTAAYTPTGAFAASSSGSRNISLITASLPDLSLSIDPSQVQYDGAIKLVSQVFGTGPYTGGYFLYTYGAEVIAEDTVNSSGTDSNGGFAAPLGTIVPVGTYAVGSTYSGDAKNSSSSITAPLKVEALFASATPNPVPANTQFTLTAYTAPNAGSSTYPTGTIQFALTPLAGGSPLLTGSGAIGANGQASVSVTVTGISGTYTVSATYAGDATHAASSYSFELVLE